MPTHTARNDLIFLLNDGELVVPPAARTYSGFLEWVFSDDVPEKLRPTYLAGVLRIDFSDEPLDIHNLVKSAFYGSMLPICATLDFGKMYPAGVLFGNEEADMATHPDALAFSWEAFEAGRVRFIDWKGAPHGVEGSPDWILEVADDNSAKWDKKNLRDAYHRAGVREYWIVDARTAQIEFQIFRWHRTGYVPSPSLNGWLKSNVFQRSFRFNRRRNRLDRWTYRLEVRAGNS